MKKLILTFSVVVLGLASSAAFASEDLILEIAWFKLNPGVEDSRVVSGAQHVQDHFLPRFDGRIYRELLAEENGGYWIDSIHWRSVADFQKAAAEILEDPAGAPLMELIDLSSMAWFHAEQVRHWRASDVPNGAGFTELQVFRLVGPGSEIEFMTPTNADEFLEAAQSIQALLGSQRGFADRELFLTQDGWWLDLVHWDSKEDAEAAGQSVMAEMANPESPAFLFAIKIDPKSLRTFRMNQRLVWQ
jgi:hypothetical protein